MKAVLVLISLFEGRGFSFPLANAYLKAHALKNPVIGKNTEIGLQHYRMQDLNFDIAWRILKGNPEIVGFSCYVWNIEKIFNLCSIIKEHSPGTAIVLGGPEVAPLAAETLRKNPCADIVVRGSGEETFAELVLHYLGKGKRLGDIAGIAFRKNGKIIETKERAMPADLNTLASPYLSEAVDLGREQEAIVELSRGCAYRCRYCFDRKNFPGVRYHPIGRIRKELEYIAQFDGVKRLYLADSTFNLNKKRALQICRIAYDVFRGRVQIGTEVRAELMDAGLAKWLAKINVGLLEIGLQSTNPTALENINRQTDLKKFENGTRLLQKENIPVQIDLITGLPGDNFSTFKESLGYAISLKPHSVIAFDLLVLPGTYLHNNASEFKLKFNPNPMHEAISNYSFSFDEMRRARTYAKSILQEYNSSFYA